ncbi:MAG: acyl-ACP--UDP-N-acetylglucosamine O-acyltransferase [bacterium]
MIHETAIVHKNARIAEGVEIGPYAFVGENVTIGRGTSIGAHAYIDGWTTIGENNKIYMNVVIGIEPQELNYRGEKSFVIIGNNNVIREFATIHRSIYEGGTTKIGDGNFLMGYTHIAHDCKLGNNIVIVNYTGLSGHVEVEDRAFLSGYVAVHQFVRIGALAMIGGSARIPKDVPPYITAEGHTAKAVGLNVVGLRRAGIPPESRRAIKKAYRILYHSGLNLKQALPRIEEEVEQTEEVKHFLDFIRRSEERTGREHRGILGSRMVEGEEGED